MKYSYKVTVRRSKFLIIIDFFLLLKVVVRNEFQYTFIIVNILETSNDSKTLELQTSYNN